MITKFSNLEDFFNFLELKRAEITRDFGLKNDFDYAENSEDILNNQISEKILEMTTEELEEIEIASGRVTKQDLNLLKEENSSSLIIQDDFIDEIINDSIILKDEGIAYDIPFTCTDDNPSFKFPLSQESSIESEIIQMSWSTILETPLKATDTTLIMEQLNLNFDDCIDDDLMDFEEPLQDITIVDPLGLDSLIFPISQCPEYEEGMDDNNCDDYNDDILDKIISVFEEEEKLAESPDEFDFDITMSQFPSTQAAQELPVASIQGRGIKLSLPSDAVLKKTAHLPEQPMISEQETTNFFGFKTGRGKELPAPSKEAMKRACSLVELDELDSEKEIEKENLGSELPIFTTGRGKAMPPPSAEAMKRAKCLIQEEFTSEYTNPVANAGFSTGRGKALPPPSEEAFARAIKLFDSCDDTINVPSSGFTSGKDKALPPPYEEAFERARKIFDVFDATPSVKNVGFSTGKGKALPPPSEEALARASKLIDNLDDTPPVTNVGFSTGKGKTLPPPSDAAMKKVASLIGTTLTHKKPLVPGNTAFKPPSLIKTDSSLKPPPKPFSMSTAWKKPRYLPKAPAPVIVKIEPVKLFDLNTKGMQRFKLKDFFKATPNLNISDCSSYGIPENILRITSKNAKDFKFSDGWGVKEAHQNLIQNGAQIVSISLDWTTNHYRWIIWKFASILRSFPEKYSIANLSPGWVLQQLLYRYEREIHQCNRSALKKIIERDDAAGKYMCLMVAGNDDETRTLELSDGWYSIWTNKLDNPFWELILNKKIFEGMKIEISGASLTGQEGIPALEASAKDCQCRLIISRNSCRPARWDTKLGFICTSNRAVAFLKYLHQIHPQGGPIPAISLIIDRVYPLLFRENSGDNHVARNEKDHYLYLETNAEQAANSKFTPIQRIKVLGNCAVESTALISFWNPLGEDQRALLQEGSVVVITNLRANSKTTKLSLVSSKSTRILKDENKQKFNLTSSIVKIDLENYFLLLNLKLNEFFDVQGVALGRVGTFFWIGGVNSGDSPNFLICLKNFNYNFNRGEIINFRDLTFNHFDNREGVAHFTFTEYSDFKKDPIKINSDSFQPVVKRFKDLTNIENG